MCSKIGDNKLQNDNFIHIAKIKGTPIHPSTMFKISFARNVLKQIWTIINQHQIQNINNNSIIINN